MVPEDILEEVFRSLDQYFASHNENIIRGITIGIELETKGRSFYLAKYDQFKRDLFHFLAEEELKHLKALENVKEIIERNGQWVEVKELQLKFFGRPKLFQGDQTEPRITSESSHRDALLAALSVERRSEDFYNRMTDKVKDEDAKTFFTALAGFERQHFETIRTLLPPDMADGVLSRLHEGRPHKHTRPRQFR